MVIWAHKNSLWSYEHQSNSLWSYEHKKKTLCGHMSTKQLSVVLWAQTNFLWSYEHKKSTRKCNSSLSLKLFLHIEKNVVLSLKCQMQGYWKWKLCMYVTDICPMLFTNEEHWKCFLTHMKVPHGIVDVKIVMYNLQT